MYFCHIFHTHTHANTHILSGNATRTTWWNWCTCRSDTTAKACYVVVRWPCVRTSSRCLNWGCWMDWLRLVWSLFCMHVWKSERKKVKKNNQKKFFFFFFFWFRTCSISWTRCTRALFRRAHWRLLRLTFDLGELVLFFNFFGSYF